ncbi:MAG: hypothetical protein AB1411_09965 [Nitrospirota bacterium]
MAIQSDRDVKKRRAILGLVMTPVLALVLTSCLPWQWDYLVEANGRATQEEIRERFGAPFQTEDFEDRSSLWTYRYEVRSSPIFRRGDMIGGLPCVEYVLTFDRKKILTYWTRQPCSPFRTRTSRAFASSPAAP